MQDEAVFGAVDPGAGDPSAVDPGAVDLTLFGCWPVGRERAARALDAGSPATAGRLSPGVPLRAARKAARRVALELKSAEALAPAESLALLLNELTVEMQAQFSAFRTLRADAQAQLGQERGTAGEAPEGRVETAAAKLARADIKAATDAMSLIVRTLEKIDGLQRQVARDRAEAERLAGADVDEASIQARLEALIERKVTERLERRLLSAGVGMGAAVLSGAEPPGDGVG